MFGTIDLPDGTKHIYLASSRQDIAAVFVQDREEGLFTGVIEPLQPAEIAVTPRFRVRRIPVGGIVLVMLGLTLMALGFVMNEPLAWFIYDMIHK